MLGLGYRARVSEPTISAFEGSRRPIRREKVEAIRGAFEAAVVEFINGGEPGVKLRRERQ